VKRPHGEKDIRKAGEEGHCPGNRNRYRIRWPLSSARTGKLVKVISIGEVLWDVLGQQEHVGGAPFNFSAHLTGLGDEVHFVSGVGNDTRGDRILEKMAELGMSPSFVRRVPQQATGVVTVTLREGGQPQFMIHRPAAYDFPQLSSAQLQGLASSPVDWIYFGTLLQTSPVARALTRQLLASLPLARRFYDVNLRNDCWTPALVHELMEQATAVKLNEEEVEDVARAMSTRHESLEHFCRSYSARFGWLGVCVTRGVRGCALLWEDQYMEAESYPVKVADTVGAGDAFAAAFLHGLGLGWPASQAADFANRVGALVASRSGAIPPWTVEEASALRSRTGAKETV
jgi:fructokinase